MQVINDGFLFPGKKVEKRKQKETKEIIISSPAHLETVN